jgi:hypothetical protein
VSRDPLARAAAVVQASEGLATKPCEACFRAGRELVPPDVYVVRSIAAVAADQCFVVYECPACGHGESYPIPRTMMLARNFRVDAVGRASGDETPALYYSVADDGLATLWLDPADGQPPLLLSQGVLRPDSATERALGAVDFLCGGDGHRPEPEPVE